MELPGACGQVGLRPAPRGARQGAPRATRPSRSPRDFARCWPTPDVDAVLIATPISTHYRARQGGARGRQARLRREADDGRPGARLASSSTRRGARACTLMVGHTFVFSPPVRKVKELIDARRAGRHLLHHHSRVNLGLHQKDVSVVWDLAPHDLSILYYWLGEAAASVQRHRPRLHRARTSPTWPSSTSRSPAAWWPRSRCSWLSPGQAAPHHRRGQQEDARLRRHRERREGQDLRPRRGLQGARRLRRVPAVSYRTGDIVAPKIERHRAAVPRGAALRRVRARPASGRSPTAWPGLQVVASLEAAEASLRRRRL